MADATTVHPNLVAATALIRQIAGRPRPSRWRPCRTQPMPVLIVTGPPGGGKTTLLDVLETRARGNVPYARLDVVPEPLDPRAALYRVAVGILGTRGRYRKLTLPRLITAEVAIAQRFGEIGSVEARGRRVPELRSALLEHRKVTKLFGFLRRNAPILSRSKAIPARWWPLILIPGALFWWLMRIPSVERRVLGAGFSWYRHRDQGLDRDPYDVLIDLNQAHNHGTATEKRTVAELMWAAFLADLRDNFRGWRARWWSINCLLLVDDADRPAGRGLVDTLVRIRARYARNGPAPLTVVAAGRVSPANANPPTPVSLARATEIRAAEPTRYAVRLDDLGFEDTRELAIAHGVPEAVYERVARDVRRFTGGHPYATDLLLTELGTGDDPPRDVAAALPAVERRMRDRLLRGLDDDQITDLVTCAAARDADYAARMAESGPLTVRRYLDDPVFADHLWTPSGSAPRRMIPVLRRLLLRELAGRTSGTATWRAAHDWARTAARAAGDEETELYHALALGAVTDVAERLTDRVTDAEVETWLRLLYAVTLAPRPAPPEPEELRTPPADPVTRLVTGLWTIHDPLNSTLWTTLRPWITSGLRHTRGAGDPRRIAVERGQFKEATDYLDSPAGRFATDVEGG